MWITRGGKQHDGFAASSQPSAGLATPGQHVHCTSSSCKNWCNQATMDTIRIFWDACVYVWGGFVAYHCLLEFAVHADILGRSRVAGSDQCMVVM
jgi:hypothetical protein